jgi:hypothetical protein
MVYVCSRWRDEHTSTLCMGECTHQLSNVLVLSHPMAVSPIRFSTYVGVPGHTDGHPYTICCQHIGSLGRSAEAASNLALVYEGHP